MLELKNNITFKESENLTLQRDFNADDHKNGIIRPIDDYNQKSGLLNKTLNKIQTFICEKLKDWNIKHKAESEVIDNNKICPDNESEMIIIKAFFEDFIKILKKLNFYFDMNFKMDTKNMINNIFEENNLFNDIKFDHKNHFDEIKNNFTYSFQQLTLEINKKKNKTLIIYNDKSFKHCDFSNLDPINRIKQRDCLVENPDRLNVLYQPPFGIFLSDFFTKNVEILNTSNRGRLADISKVHDYDYIMSIKNMCEKVSKEGNTQIFKYGNFLSFLISGPHLLYYSYLVIFNSPFL